MPAFTGQLKSNEIFAALYNMIISQQVFADNIAGGDDELLEMCRVDGSLYGDTKIYYGTDVNRSVPWLNDAEATNLLKLHRPADPEVQAIVLDKFRQISLTIDYYLTKRAWATEGAFSEFQTVTLGWMVLTKHVYSNKLIKTYFGTTKTTIAEQNQVITLPTDTDPERQARLQGQTIAEHIANLIVYITKDETRKFNDWELLRKYPLKDLVFIWNSAWLNKIAKIDLPTIFHKDNLVPMLGDYMLPQNFFGTVKTTAGTTAADNTTIRTLVEMELNRNADDTIMDQNNRNYDKKKHIFPGDLIPASTAYAANEAYEVDPNIICKIVHRRSVPFMSAFEVGTTFFNAKALTENHYLTWGYNTIEYLKNYPFITVSKA